MTDLELLVELRIEEEPRENHHHHHRIRNQNPRLAAAAAEGWVAYSEYSGIVVVIEGVGNWVVGSFAAAEYKERTVVVVVVDKMTKDMVAERGIAERGIAVVLDLTKYNP